MFLQGRYTGGRLHGYFVQEVDVNRDWKSEEAGESTLEPTSTFLSLRFKASEAIDLNAGYVTRAEGRIPSQGSRDPWRFNQSVALDRALLRGQPIDDGTLRFVEKQPARGDALEPTSPRPNTVATATP